ncbi:hypothetical protein AGMMS49525_17220 [Bacteroidia bacterium]|nr:hypothetical protein AGMMS49525_17220 [Bacteroidia bacterium]
MRFLQGSEKSEIKDDRHEQVNDFATKETTIIFLSENLKSQKQIAELLQQNVERLQQLMDLFINNAAAHS